jgi:hypothetical protein
MSAATTEAGFATPSQTKVAGRDLAIDSLRGVAILMVIGIHCI